MGTENLMDLTKFEGLSDSAGFGIEDDCGKTCFHQDESNHLGSGGPGGAVRTLWASQK